MVNACYYIKEISAKTGVKAGTIRFYEKLGFLEPVARMSNQYQVFNEHHIYQIRVCSLVFGGFVNTRLRKISMEIITAVKDWDLEAYDSATRNYLQAIEQDITRTPKAVSIVTKQIDQNAELIQKITKALAALHTDETPSFMCKDKEKAELLSDQMITECLSGWKSVLAEHPGSFSESQLEELAGKINKLIAWHESEDRVLVHGDFHWDNLLEDENGNILLCDWQGVNIGGASGDLSFFLSRLGADGIRIDDVFFLDSYVNAVWEFSGKQMKRQDIIRHMSAANVITSFVFWHHYLQGSSEKQVGDIYNKMTKDFKALQEGLVFS